MFTHQLIAEMAPSLTDRAAPASLNDSDDIRRLLEQHTGFGQFRVVLPGTVSWAPDTTTLRGHGDPEASTPSTLEELVLAYVPQDRARIVDAITVAIKEHKGFRFSARMRVGSEIRVIETIGDVKVIHGTVTEVFGLVRDITKTLDRDALAISRARLIRHMVEDMPIAVVVLDRALRVIACSSDWVRAYGLPDRAAALNQPLGRLIEVTRETTSGIIEALNGRTAHIGLWFHSGEDRRQVRRTCAVLPWQCGTELPGGVMIVVGGEQSYASLDIADRALGRTTRTLLQMLETVTAAA